MSNMGLAVSIEMGIFDKKNIKLVFGNKYLTYMPIFTRFIKLGSRFFYREVLQTVENGIKNQIFQAVARQLLAPLLLRYIVLPLKIISKFLIRVEIFL